MKIPLTVASLLFVCACAEIEVASQSHAIIGGKSADSALFDAVGEIADENGTHCTLTLVSKRHALTAGHCVDGNKNLKTLKVRFFPHGRTVESFHIKNAKLHPGYRRVPVRNDIAVVELDGEPSINALPVADFDEAYAKGARHITLAGYGRDENGAYGNKKCVEVPVLDFCADNKGCTVYYPDDELFHEIKLSPGALLYEQKGGGLCLGDSGGPALLIEDGQATIVAVTSFASTHCNLYGSGNSLKRHCRFVNRHVPDADLRFCPEDPKKKSCSLRDFRHSYSAFYPLPLLALFLASRLNLRRRHERQTIMGKVSTIFVRLPRNSHEFRYQQNALPRKLLRNDESRRR